MTREVKKTEEKLSSVLVVFLFAAAACVPLAHGCHPGDHGDADLVIQAITAAAPSPVADAQSAIQERSRTADP